MREAIEVKVGPDPGPGLSASRVQGPTDLQEDIDQGAIPGLRREESTLLKDIPQEGTILDRKNLVIEAMREKIGEENLLEKMKI